MSKNDEDLLFISADREVNENLDFATAHEQLKKDKLTREKKLHLILVGFQAIESTVSKICSQYVKKLPSKELEDWSEKPYINIIEKLKGLRFAKIIDENFYSDLKILTKIRNIFAHKLFPSNISFQELSTIHFHDVYLSKLPNDTIKYSLICSAYFLKLVKILQTIHPASVMHLELDKYYGIKEPDEIPIPNLKKTKSMKSLPKKPQKKSKSN